MPLCCLYVCAIEGKKALTLIVMKKIFRGNGGSGCESRIAYLSRAVAVD